MVFVQSSLHYSHEPRTAGLLAGQVNSTTMGNQGQQHNDWRGPDDPDCPYNWPMWKRIYVTSIPALLCVNV